MMTILVAFRDKLRMLSRSRGQVIMDDAEGKGAGQISSEEGEGPSIAITTGQVTPHTVREARFLFRNLLGGVKTILHTLRHLPAMEGSRGREGKWRVQEDADILRGIFEDGLSCFYYYYHPRFSTKAASSITGDSETSGSTRSTSSSVSTSSTATNSSLHLEKGEDLGVEAELSPSDETEAREAIEVFSGIWLGMDGPMFQEVLHPPDQVSFDKEKGPMGSLVRSIGHYPSLLAIPRTLLLIHIPYANHQQGGLDRDGKATPGPHPAHASFPGRSPFAGILLRYLLVRLGRLGQPGIEGRRLLSLWNLIFSSYKVYPEANEALLLPHVGSLIVRCMRLGGGEGKWEEEEGVEEQDSSYESSGPLIWKKRVKKERSRMQGTLKKDEEPLAGEIKMDDDDDGNASNDNADKGKEKGGHPRGASTFSSTDSRTVLPKSAQPQEDGGIRYYLLLKSLFRTIGSGRYEALYHEVAPLMHFMLEGFNDLLLQSTSSSPSSTADLEEMVAWDETGREWVYGRRERDRERARREVYVELCLTVPVRLNGLLPFIQYLIRPLTLALGSKRNPELSGQGLRTLELCIDHLTPVFLEPILAPVSPKLMKALWRHLQPLGISRAKGEAGSSPEGHALSAQRILGKLGGRNRSILYEPEGGEGGEEMEEWEEEEGNGWGNPADWEGVFGVWTPKRSGQTSSHFDQEVEEGGSMEESTPMEKRPNPDSSGLPLLDQDHPAMGEWVGMMELLKSSEKVILGWDSLASEDQDDVDKAIEVIGRVLEWVVKESEVDGENDVSVGGIPGQEREGLRVLRETLPQALDGEEAAGMDKEALLQEERIRWRRRRIRWLIGRLSSILLEGMWRKGRTKDPRVETMDEEEEQRRAKARAYLIRSIQWLAVSSQTPSISSGQRQWRQRLLLDLLEGTLSAPCMAIRAEGEVFLQEDILAHAPLSPQIWEVLIERLSSQCWRAETGGLGRRRRGGGQGGPVSALRVTLSVIKSLSEENALPIGWLKRREPDFLRALLQSCKERANAIVQVEDNIDGVLMSERISEQKKEEGEGEGEREDKSKGKEEKGGQREPKEQVEGEEELDWDIKETLLLLLDICHPLASSQKKSSGEVDTEMKEVNDPWNEAADQTLVVSLLVSELASPHAAVRGQTLRLLRLLSLRQGNQATSGRRGIGALVGPVRDVLLQPIFNKPLRALPLQMQIGCVSAVAVCLELDESEEAGSSVDESSGSSGKAKGRWRQLIIYSPWTIPSMSFSYPSH